MCAFFYAVKKFGNREMQRGEGNKKNLHLPFAGITLFRFNGYNLSLPLLVESTPGRNRPVSYCKNKYEKLI